jgi:hypothetical protein
MILDSRQTGVPAAEFPEWAIALPANIDMLTASALTASAVAVNLKVFIYVYPHFFHNCKELHLYVSLIELENSQF